MTITSSRTETTPTTQAPVSRRGLAIAGAVSLAADHGGQVVAMGERADRGTTVRLTLPALDGG